MNNFNKFIAWRLDNTETQLNHVKLPSLAKTELQRNEYRRDTSNSAFWIYS